MEQIQNRVTLIAIRIYVIMLNRLILSKYGMTLKVYTAVPPVMIKPYNSWMQGFLKRNKIKIKFKVKLMQERYKCLHMFDTHIINHYPQKKNVPVSNIRSQFLMQRIISLGVWSSFMFLLGKRVGGPGGKLPCERCGDSHCLF